MLFLQISRAVLELSNIDLAEIKLRSRLAEQATTYALSKTVRSLLRNNNSLALLFDPIVLLFEVRRAGDMPRLFLRERRHVVLELLDRKFRIGSLLLLCLDHLVQFAQLRVESRQRRTFFLQPALRLAVLRLG